MFKLIAIVVIAISAVAGDTYSWSKVTANQVTKPSARFDSGCAQDGNLAYVFGGNTVNGLANDLWSLDIRSGSFQWTAVPMVGDLPAKRKDSSAFFFWDSLYVWGGTNKTVVFSDMWKYTPSSNTFQWVKVSAAEQNTVALLARTGTFASKVGGQALTFGGKSPAGFTNDLISYVPSGANGVKATALPIKSAAAPSPRQYTPLAVAGNNVYSFGGSNGTNQGDFWRGTILGNGASVSWTRLAGGPPARSGHVVYSDGQQIIVATGEDQTGSSSLNDTWVYTIATGVWTQVAAASPPLRRLGACYFTAPACSVQSERYVLYGGVTGFGSSDYKLDDVWELLVARS